MEKPKNYRDYVDKKVRMVNENSHKWNPDWYPKAGTVGTIDNFGWTDNTVGVDWGKNSGVSKNCDGRYVWYISWKSIELVDDTDSHMSDEEIWEMFKPKMEKLGINPDGNFIKYNNLNEHKNYMDVDTVQKLLATAYRSGYGRGQKGRPFVIGEKKQGPHWEWIKPGEIVPDGTKVRYARKVGPSGNSIWTDWKIGYEGKVTSEEDWDSENSFWVDHFCLDSSRDCFQKWVEDDE